MKTRSRILLVTLLSRSRAPIKILIRGFRSRTIITRCYSLRMVRMVIMMKVRLVHARSGSSSWKIWRILLYMAGMGMGRVVPMVGIFGVMKWGIFGPRWHGILRWYGHDYSKLETDPWVILLPSAGGAELNSKAGLAAEVAADCKPPSAFYYMKTFFLSPSPRQMARSKADLATLCSLDIAKNYLHFFSQKCHNKFRIAMKETRHFPGPLTNRKFKRCLDVYFF